MKMKAVCEATGLTDRTIRYYIEEELISPAYTENYLGRKTFDFSEGDIQQLNDIAVLRKFGFSISEIRDMIQHPEQILRIAKELHGRKQNMIGEEQDFLLTLSRLNEENVGTVAELAKYLSMTVTDVSLPVEDTTAEVNDYICGMFSGLLRKILVLPIVWAPMVLSVLALLSRWKRYRYPVVDYVFVVAWILCVVPSVLYGFLARAKKQARWKKVAKGLLLIPCLYCAVAAPLTVWQGMISGSETTDFQDYRYFDVECEANNDGLFQNLFPEEPHYYEVTDRQPNGRGTAVYLDASYCYQFSQRYPWFCNIYAEWPLEQEAFSLEINRVKSVFDNYTSSEAYEAGRQEYLTVQKGPYTCMIVYFGEEPFTQTEGSYTYWIFAYNEQTYRVRYIYCQRWGDWEDQPYYLTLDWE